MNVRAITELAYLNNMISFNNFLRNTFSWGANPWTSPFQCANRLKIVTKMFRNSHNHRSYLTNNTRRKNKQITTYEYSSQATDQRKEKQSNELTCILSRQMSLNTTISQPTRQNIKKKKKKKKKAAKSDKARQRTTNARSNALEMSLLKLPRKGIKSIFICCRMRRQSYKNYLQIRYRIRRPWVSWYDTVPGDTSIF